MPSNFSSSSIPPALSELQTHEAFIKHNIIHFLPSQKGRYNGSLKLQRRTLARPCERSRIVSGFVVFGLAAGSRDLQVHDNKKKAGNLIQSSSDGGGDEDTGLVWAATPLHDDDEDGSVAGLSSASKAPIYTTATLLTGDTMPIYTSTTTSQITGNTDELSRIEHSHSIDVVSTPSTTSSEMIMQAQTKQRMLRKKTEQLTYLFAAVASSVGITSLAGASVYCRFAWQMQGGEVPWTEMCGTFSLALGAAVGMEYWARWAHRVLWHASLWSMHESHHQPRDGPLELNDVFAIINAVPAIALMAFGFLNKGLVPGLCFGAGLGITMFGIAYMFVHDGLVHRRFPVGPIADVPYFQKVAAAHQLHHADKFNGVPYGLFLGPMELAEVGGKNELEKLVQKRKRESKNPINS